MDEEDEYFFKCKPPEVHFTIGNRVPYNKLLTNRACWGRTGEYWPSVVFVRTSLRLVRNVTTSGQYSPVRPSRLVSKRLLLYGKPSLRQIPVLWLFFFSVRILQHGPFAWKRSNLCIFVLEQSRQIQHLQPRQRKKSVKIVILHIETTSRSQKDWKFSEFQRWMKKMNIF